MPVSGVRGGTLSDLAAGQLELDHAALDGLVGDVTTLAAGRTLKRIVIDDPDAEPRVEIWRRPASGPSGEHLAQPGSKTQQ